MSEIPYGYCKCGCGQKTNLARDTNRTAGYVKGEPYEFVYQHKRPKLGYDEEDRGYDTPCWIWQGWAEGGRYGKIYRRGRHFGVHRFYYEEAMGPIPEGLQLDHLCRVPACVNPDHLEPVTAAENRRRSPVNRLSMEIAREIREIRSATGVTQAELASRYGVARSTIGNVLNNKLWNEEVT